MFDMDEQKFAINCKITYKLFFRQGAEFSTDSPETKTELADVVLSVRKYVEAVLCYLVTSYHHELIIQN